MRAPCEYLEPVGKRDQAVRLEPLEERFERRQPRAVLVANENRLVTNEAASTETDSGTQIGRPDPLVEPHPLRDVLYVGAHELADVRDLVDEADPRPEERVRSELDHLR